MRSAAADLAYRMVARRAGRLGRLRLAMVGWAGAAQLAKAARAAEAISSQAELACRHKGEFVRCSPA